MVDLKSQAAHSLCWIAKEALASLVQVLAQNGSVQGDRLFCNSPSVADSVSRKLQAKAPEAAARCKGKI